MHDESILTPLPTALLASLRRHIPAPPDVAVVLGSGLGAYSDRLLVEARIDTSTLPYYPQSTVEGHSGELLLGSAHGRRVLVFRGRLHGYEGHSAAVSALPARIAAALGIPLLIVTNAAGGLHPSFRAGDLMLINDYVVLPMALHMGLCLHGPGNHDVPTRRIAAFREDDLASVRRAAATCAVPLKEGSYGFCSGPTYETRAEIAMLRLMGADAVGMSTVPELVVALRSGMRVIGISCITNKAVTVPQRVTHEEVTTVAAKVSTQFSALLDALIANLPDTRPTATEGPRP
ncbi:MAG TPA: purine-nucleoside phosphorylase [Bacteroidota bacterium]|nr:purine-nucleoside phosphorylase [Bacteroidota bacterium]